MPACRTNICGYFSMARAAAPHMQPGSAIVNTGSIAGLQRNEELLDYSATKAGSTRFASNADSSYITGEVLTLPGGETTAA